MNKKEKEQIFNLGQAYITDNQYLIRNILLDLVKQIPAKSSSREMSKSKYISEKLESREYEVPTHLQGIIEMKTPNEFDETKFYISPREKELFIKIYKNYVVAKKLDALNINYLNSTLLHGASGTGKTMFGQYVAYKLNVPFIYINFGNLISSYMGKTGNNLSQIFDYVKSIKCVFMIDEIDAISSKRNSSTSVDNETSRITLSLMQNLDKLNSNTVFLSATNRFDIIDDAVVRRFTNIHKVNVFTDEEKHEMCQKYLDNLNFEKLNNFNTFKNIESIEDFENNENTEKIKNIEFSDEEISNIIKNNKDKTQSYVINDLVQEIVNKLSEDVKLDNV